MRPRVLVVLCALLAMSGAAHATSFVVPDDAELVAKSRAIVVGSVEGSFVQETDGVIETVYEVRIERTMKGLFRGPELVRVVAPGGVLGDRALLVEGAAHFDQGERVLLFLTHDERNRFVVTDLTLGKFRFVVSTAGERLLVREMEDVVGWDHHGRVHREKVRREEGFLHFVSEAIQKRVAADDYLVEASEVTLPPREEKRIAVNAPFPAETYTSWVSGQPTRWPNMAAGVTWHKRADQNIPGAADGGVSVIQNGLAAWANECGSIINYNYGGTTTTPSTNFDSVRVVEFNDPQNRIAGAWSGSGTIGICFLSFSSSHSFNSKTWWSISDADVVFQNGYSATHASFPTAMTHELGHGLGWRHSNQDYATGGACNASTQECTSAAIMNSTVNSGYGYNLQPWDVNAAQSVYPGGVCGPACVPPVITGHPQSTSTTSGSPRTLSVSATGTGPLAYQWFMGTSPNATDPIPGATGSSISVNPTVTTNYWVRVSNGCGTANSNTATVTVQPGTPPPGGGTEYDFNGDGRADVGVFHPANGQWYVQGLPSAVQWGGSGDTPVPADYNGDGRTDIGVFRRATGVWYVQSLPSAVQWGQSGDIPVPADYTGDGRADIGVFRPSTGQWFVQGLPTTVQWGQSGDIPVPADYTGDGRADIGVFRPSTGQWHVQGLPTTVQWGQNGDIPIPADFNGDGRADIGVFRPSNGQWYSQGLGSAVQWGQNGDIPIPADFNGDGRADVGVFRPSNGQWYSLGLPTTVQWGQSGDIPVEAPIARR
jgi:hypothetical protein